MVIERRKIQSYRGIKKVWGYREGWDSETVDTKNLSLGKDFDIEGFNAIPVK